MLQREQDTAPLLSAVNLAVHRRGVPVLQSVALNLQAGQTLWVDGPSGSGKTSLLLSLARLLPISKGALALGGVSAELIDAPKWRAQVLLVPHPPLPLGNSVGDDLRTPYRLHQRRTQMPPTPDALLEELASLGLGEVTLEQPAQLLSQGQLARLSLARALLAQPQVLLLDEPTANLDAGAAERVETRMAAYCRGGGAVIVAAHTTPWRATTQVLRLASASPERVAP